MHELIGLGNNLSITVMLLLDVATRPVRGQRNGKERERIERERERRKG